FGEAILDLDMLRALQFQLGRVRRRMSQREFILALGLHLAEEMQTVGFDLRDYWIGISSAKDFLGTVPSYTFIKDPMLRLCHRLIAYSIAGRSQAPEKVTVTDLFYLRGAMISGGQYVARLAEHFGLLTEERLQGLTIISPTLPIINMAELVRLQLCAELDDTWAWHRGGDEDEEIPRAVPPPPRTQGERTSRLEEEVHGVREALQGQREVQDSMAHDFQVLYMDCQ
nr:hypothetical protein [Tanacetum cinerariifolium]